MLSCTRTHTHTGAVCWRTLWSLLKRLGVTHTHTHTHTQHMEERSGRGRLGCRWPMQVCEDALDLPNCHPQQTHTENPPQRLHCGKGQPIGPLGHRDTPFVPITGQRHNPATRKTKTQSHPSVVFTRTGSARQWPRSGSSFCEQWDNCSILSNQTYFSPVVWDKQCGQIPLAKKTQNLVCEHTKDQVAYFLSVYGIPRPQPHAQRCMHVQGSHCRRAHYASKTTGKMPRTAVHPFCATFGHLNSLLGSGLRDNCMPISGSHHQVPTIVETFNGLRVDNRRLVLKASNKFLSAEAA